MKKPSAQGNDYRWLAGLLVLTAVLIILGLKAAQARGNPSDALAQADQVARLEGPQLKLAAIATTAPTEPDAAPAAQEEDDPFPAHPEEQINWAVRNQKPAMILFHSLTCIPCKKMEQLVKEVRGDYENAIVFVDVITDDRANIPLLRQAGVRTIPTSFFMLPSGEAKGTIGAMTKEALVRELDSLVAGE